MRGVYMTDEEFEAEVAKRREALDLADGEIAVGCPLCSATDFPVAAGGQQ